MYKIVNRTDSTVEEHEGSFPYVLLHDALDNGKEIIVIDTITLIIYVPKLDTKMYGKNQWMWMDYHQLPHNNKYFGEQH